MDKRNKRSIEEKRRLFSGRKGRRRVMAFLLLFALVLQLLPESATKAEASGGSAAPASHPSAGEAGHGGSSAHAHSHSGAH